MSNFIVNSFQVTSLIVDELMSTVSANAFSSRCGYKNISLMFSVLYPKCDKIVIEN
ncbi:hypothetical protein RHO14_08930 [Orbus wheelerorum]|uniref:hypothetical protein n=1 Tax=Orbus wheelerorum TaxID=3074111 RepID=UPI00370D5C4C